MSPENYTLIRKLIKSIAKKAIIVNEVLEKDPLSKKQEQQLEGLVKKLEKSLNLIS